VVDVSPDPGKVVLVVDDEEQVRKLTCRILQCAGYAVLSARSGPEALKMSRADYAIDLLLSDVEMEGMRGIELGNQVKSERPGMAVLLCSGNLAHAAESAFPFLGKPFVPKDLLSAVTNALAGQPAPEAAPSVTEPTPVAGPVVVVRIPPRRRSMSVPLRVAAAVAICLIPFGIYEVSRPSVAMDTVNLRTWRGLAGSAAAKAGKALVLNLNLTGIPRHDSYRIELVDREGRLIWQQVIPATSSEILQAKSAALRSGLYYIRAHASPEGLLREYELRIGENQ
jgi:CheY-like chemotaxis protein